MLDVNIISMKSQSDIKKHMFDNIRTETNYRKWKRRLLVALTDEEIEKCKYYLKKYRFEV